MTLTNLALEATIIAGGKTYPGWESVEIWREFANPVSYMRFTASEDENFAASYMRSRQAIRRKAFFAASNAWTAM